MAAFKLLPYDVWTSQITQASIPANQNSLRNEIINKGVIAIQNIQPSEPEDGDLYIVGSAPTGSQWSSFTAFNLTMFKAGNWYEFESYVGLLKTVGGNTLWVYTGTEYTKIEVGSLGTSFIDLTDTPANFSGSGGKTLKVNVAENAVEFVEDLPAEVPENIKFGNIGCTFDGGSKVIESGKFGDILIPFNCEILEWYITCYPVGSATVQVLNCENSDYPNFYSITSGSNPSISAGNMSSSGDSSDWLNLSQNQYVRFSINSITDLQKLTINLKVKKKDI